MNAALPKSHREVAWLHMPCCPHYPVSSLWAGWAGSRRHRCRPDWPLLYRSLSPAASTLRSQNPGKWLTLKQWEQRSKQLPEGHALSIASPCTFESMFNFRRSREEKQQPTAQRLRLQPPCHFEPLCARRSLEGSAFRHSPAVLCSDIADSKAKVPKPRGCLSAVTCSD